MVVISLVLALLALAVAALALRGALSMKQRLNAILGGTQEGSLESMLRTHIGRVEEVSDNLDDLQEQYKHLAVTGSLASQKISIVRFNPFGDTGGDQSFSLAVLDAQDSGYVLTSIHGRQGTRVYVKPVDFGKSKYTLSAEEQQALSQAAKRVPKID